MRTLLIDDFRDLKADRVARTFDDGITALRDEGPWEMLYLDHDLGEQPPKDGYGIACWLERNINRFPEQIIIVSSNPVGVKNIERVLDRFYYKTGVTWVL